MAAGWAFFCVKRRCTRRRKPGPVAKHIDKWRGESVSWKYMQPNAAEQKMLEELAISVTFS
jgi:hypothetical protein